MPQSNNEENGTYGMKLIHCPRLTIYPYIYHKTLCVLQSPILLLCARLLQDDLEDCFKCLKKILSLLNFLGHNFLRIFETGTLLRIYLRAHVKFNLILCKVSERNHKDN